MPTATGNAAFESQRGDGHLPSFVHRTDQVFAWDTHAVEEHFVEMVMAVHHHQRTHLHAARMHVVEQQVTDPLMLGRVGIGARQQEHSVGDDNPTLPASANFCCHARRFSNTSWLGAIRSSIGSSMHNSAGKLSRSHSRTCARNASCSGVYSKSISTSNRPEACAANKFS